MTLEQVCEELERELELGDCVGWTRDEKRYIRLLVAYGNLLLDCSLEAGLGPAFARFEALEKRTKQDPDLELTGPVV